MIGVSTLDPFEFLSRPVVYLLSNITMPFRARRLRSSIANHQSKKSKQNSDKYEANEEFVKDSPKHDIDKRHAAILRTKLKKLGITNIDEHLRNVKQLDKSKSRKTRSSIKPADTPQSPNKKVPKSPKQTPATDILDEKTAKSGRRSRSNSTTKAPNRKRKAPWTLNTQSTVASLLTAAKSTYRKPSSEYDSTEEDHHKRRGPTEPKRRYRSNSNGRDDNSLSNSNFDTDSEEHHIVDETCKVPGCDSKGHLSGAFSIHKMLDTCPTFHNLTAEECSTKFRRRLENDKKQSPNKSRKSPTKRNRSLENDAKWNSLMEERKTEMHDNSINQTGEVMTMVTSSRQPNLVGFTPSFDLDLFIESQSRTAQMIHWNSAVELERDDKTSRGQPGVQSIVMGKREIDVWYASPYSDDFLNCQKLFICEFCLRCMNSSIILQRHINKCTLRHPPGREIYRKGHISFFEIDGNKQKEYCQNLCLLAKLFLDHKTLFFETEPFLFYIMTECDERGMHLMGYFSKEKHSSNNYNVSCILTLPSYQRVGYGRMLIEFSYLLTRAEGKVGSPERPLSDLGLISYRSYWKFAIMEYLSTYEGKDISLKDMSQQTGINSTDIVSTLQLMGLCKYWKGNHLILLPPEAKEQFVNEVKKKRKAYSDRVIDPKCLHWSPPTWQNGFTKK